MQGTTCLLYYYTRHFQSDPYSSTRDQFSWVFGKLVQKLVACLTASSISSRILEQSTDFDWKMTAFLNLHICYTVAAKHNLLNWSAKEFDLKCAASQPRFWSQEHEPLKVRHICWTLAHTGLVMQQLKYRCSMLSSALWQKTHMLDIRDTPHFRSLSIVGNFFLHKSQTIKAYLGTEPLPQTNLLHDTSPLVVYRAFMTDLVLNTPERHPSQTTWSSKSVKGTRLSGVTSFNLLTPAVAFLPVGHFHFPSTMMSDNNAKGLQQKFCKRFLVKHLYEGPRGCPWAN